MRMRTRTISTSAQWKTMSNKPLFGRDAKEFLKNLGGDSSAACECAENGVMIRALAPSGGEKVVVRVNVANPSGSEQVEFLIMNEHAEALGLTVGHIEEELLPELEYYAEVARAYSSVCASFAYTPSSLRALCRKVMQKGFARDVCEDAIQCVRMRGFVNESEIAHRRAQLCVEKRWGRSRILMKLREEGFDDDSLKDAKKYLDEVDFIASCCELIQKRFGKVSADPHERELICASLARMGHSISDVRRAMEMCERQIEPE